MTLVGPFLHVPKHVLDLASSNNVGKQGPYQLESAISSIEDNIIYRKLQELCTVISRCTAGYPRKYTHWKFTDFYYTI